MQTSKPPATNRAARLTHQPVAKGLGFLLEVMRDIEGKTAHISRTADTGPDFLVPLAERLSLRLRELKGLDDGNITDLLNYLEPYRRYGLYLYHIIACC